MTLTLMSIAGRSLFLMMPSFACDFPLLFFPAAAAEAEAAAWFLAAAVLR